MKIFAALTSPNYSVIQPKPKVSFSVKNRKQLRLPGVSPCLCEFFVVFVVFVILNKIPYERITE